MVKESMAGVSAASALMFFEFCTSIEFLFIRRAVLSI